jgi:hypothetical protein
MVEFCTFYSLEIKKVKTRNSSTKLMVNCNLLKYKNESYGMNNLVFVIYEWSEFKILYFIFFIKIFIIYKDFCPIL